MLKKTIKPIFILLFFSYMMIYILSAAGYYEYKNYEKMILTEEQIRKFEDDVKAGLDVDVTDYIKEEKVNHNNKIANTGKKLSALISSMMTKGMTESFKVLSKLVEDWLWFKIVLEYKVWRVYGKGYIKYCY